MFRVPVDQDSPTFDETFKVGFWRWLASKAPERKEWARRRNAAAQLAKVNQQARMAEFVEEKRVEKRRKRQG